MSAYVIFRFQKDRLFFPNIFLSISTTESRSFSPRTLIFSSLEIIASLQLYYSFNRIRDFSVRTESTKLFLNRKIYFSSDALHGPIDFYLKMD